MQEIFHIVFYMMFWGDFRLELAWSVWTLRVLWSCVFISKVSLFYKINKLLSVRKSESNKSKEIDKIFIGEYTIINPLKVLIQINRFNKILSVLLIFELINNLFNKNLFFMITVKQIKRSLYYKFLLWL